MGKMVGRLFLYVKGRTRCRYKTHYSISRYILNVMAAAASKKTVSIPGTRSCSLPRVLITKLAYSSVCTVLEVSNKFNATL